MKDSPTVEAHAPDSSNTSGPRSGFRAHLQGVGLHDLVMLQNLVRASGAFVVLSGERTGSLCFSRGQLVHAETAELAGDAAALEILSWREGEFINTEQRQSVEKHTVTASLESLLLRLARDLDEPAHVEPSASEAPLSSATGVRRRIDGPSPFRTTHLGIGVPSLPQGSSAPSGGLAAAATPGVAAASKSPGRAADPRPGVTNVLLGPHGALVDGNGQDAEGLGSKVAYMVRLTELIGQAMGAGETRGARVRHPGVELSFRRHPDGHVSASAGPAEAGADVPPGASPPPPSTRYT